MVTTIDNGLAVLPPELREAHRQFIVTVEFIRKHHMARMIDLLTRIETAGNHSLIAKSIGVGDREFRRFIKRARKKGFGFTIGINYPAIGLTELRIFMPQMLSLNKVPMKSWLELYSQTFNPAGTSLSYYMPYSLRREFIRRLSIELKNIGVNGELEAKIFYNRFRNQPKYSSLKIVDFFQFNVKLWTKKLSELEEYSRAKKYSVLPSFLEPFDSIDLLILRELEHDALKTVYELASIYPFSPKVFQKHISQHIESRGVIKGIYLKQKFINVFSNLFINIDLRVTQRDYVELIVPLFKQMPWVTYISIGSEATLGANGFYESTELTSILASFVIPVNIVGDLIRFLEYLRETGFIYKIKIICHDPMSLRRRGIPYSNFDQETRSWTLDVEHSYMLLKNRILRFVRPVE